MSVQEVGIVRNPPTVLNDVLHVDLRNLRKRSLDRLGVGVICVGQEVAEPAGVGVVGHADRHINRDRGSRGVQVVPPSCAPMVANVRARVKGKSAGVT